MAAAPPAPAGRSTDGGPRSPASRPPALRAPAAAHAAAAFVTRSPAWPKSDPSAGVPCHPLPRLAEVDALGQGHLHPPGRALLPARSGKIGRRRSKRISRIVRPDVAPPIAGEINREGKIGGRDELGVAHRPRPASGHPD